MKHYNDVIIGTRVSQITSLTIVYSTVYSGADQRKHQSSASLAFVRGIHRGPVNSPHKGPVTQKKFSFDDVIMIILKTMTPQQNKTKKRELCASLAGYTICTKWWRCETFWINHACWNSVDIHPMEITSIAKVKTWIILKKYVLPRPQAIEREDILSLLSQDIADSYPANGMWIIYIARFSCEIVLVWTPQGLADGYSTFIQVLAWCRLATSHYLSQCWDLYRHMAPLGHNEITETLLTWSKKIHRKRALWIYKPDTKVSLCPNPTFSWL